MKIKILLSIISLAYILFSNNVLANQYGINTISECRDSINRLTYDVSKLNRIVFSKNQKKNYYDLFIEASTLVDVWSNVSGGCAEVSAGNEFNKKIDRLWSEIADLRSITLKESKSDQSSREKKKYDIVYCYAKNGKTFFKSFDGCGLYEIEITKCEFEEKSVSKALERRCNNNKNIQIVEPNKTRLYCKYKNGVIITGILEDCGNLIEVTEDEYNKSIGRENKKKIAEAKKKEEEAKQAQDEGLYVIGSGTGFFVNDEGYVVTNEHVAGICQSLASYINGKTHIFNILALDNRNDLALLRGEYRNKNFLNINPLGAEFGQDIMAFGFPLAENLSSSVKLTRGIVSSLSGPENDISLIQIDAAIQPGNSGGPVLNYNGQVVGVASSGLNKSAMYEESSYIPENVNFAVAATTLTGFLKSNSVKIFNESFDQKSSQELAKIGMPPTIQLHCLNTIAAHNQLRESKNYNDVLLKKVVNLK